MDELKPCPFCGGTDIYETYSQEYAYGTRRPEIFCNTCKSIFSVEDDSPYMNCDEDFKYRKEKTRETWNRRRNDNDSVPVHHIRLHDGDSDNHDQKVIGQ